MAREMITERGIMAAFIGHHRGFFRNIGLDDRDDIGRAGAIDMERADLSAFAVNERQDCILVAVAATLNSSFFASDESFVRFDYTTGPPKGVSSPERIASRSRCVMNQAVL